MNAVECPAMTFTPVTAGGGVASSAVELLITTVCAAATAADVEATNPGPDFSTRDSVIASRNVITRSRGSVFGPSASRMSERARMAVMALLTMSGMSALETSGIAGSFVGIRRFPPSRTRFAPAESGP